MSVGVREHTRTHCHTHVHSASKLTKAHANTHVLHLTCGWFVPYTNLLLDVCIYAHVQTQKFFSSIASASYTVNSNIVTYVASYVVFIIIFVGSLTVTGVVLYAYFWLLYVCHLALKVFYPLKSAKIFNSDHSRIICIAAILIIFLIGTVPSIILATVGSNYRIIGFPPIYCGIGLTYRIYVLVIPIMVTNSAIVILMLLIVYSLHTVSLMVYVYSYACIYYIITACMIDM